MESRRQCPASSGSLTAHSSSSSLLCRAFWGEPPWDPADTNPALVSASGISPCQVKELELLGGSELLLQPLLGCGALLRAQPPQPPWLLCSPKSAPGVSVHLKTEKVFFKRMRRVRKTSRARRVMDVQIILHYFPLVCWECSVQLFHTNPICELCCIC